MAKPKQLNASVLDAKGFIRDHVDLGDKSILVVHNGPVGGRPFKRERWGRTHEGVMPTKTYIVGWRKGGVEYEPLYPYRGKEEAVAAVKKAFPKHNFGSEQDLLTIIAKHEEKLRREAEKGKSMDSYNYTPPEEPRRERRDRWDLW